MDTLCSIVLQLGKKYQIFIPMVQKVLATHRISHQRYDVLISRIIKVRASSFFFFFLGFMKLLQIGNLYLFSFRALYLRKMTIPSCLQKRKLVQNLMIQISLLLVVTLETLEGNCLLIFITYKGLVYLYCSHKNT